MENKNKTMESFIKEADKRKKTSEEIVKMMQNYYNKEALNLKKIKRHTQFYESGGDLESDEYGRNKIILQMAKRICKTHASYVLKDHPNINIKAKNEEIPESNELASNTKKHLLLWHREQRITRRLKRSVRKASYKSVVGFYLSNDPENQTITFNTVDPEMMAYERLSDDPSSPLLWFAKGAEISTRVLKEAFPNKKDEITPYKTSKFFQTMNNLTIFDGSVQDDKAFYYTLMDSNYLYEYVNDVEISVKEHNYPFIPAYIFPYFDFDSREVVSLIDYIESPLKMINQAFGFRMDFTDRHSDPILKVIGNSKGINPEKLRGGLLEIEMGADASFIGPQASSIDIEKMIELLKSFTHFLCGLSEEAMAGFTGSLTAAGVSIELRLDSTVREALDTQIILQDILENINRDYLKLVEKFYPEKNLFESKILGIKGDKKFTGKQIAGLYDNTVDFGGILPRSQDQIVRNSVTKFTTGLISQDTALSEMNYPDPNIEVKKMRSEIIAKSKLEKDIAQGRTPGEKFFETPEQENMYMFETQLMATPAPDQDHQYHIATHEKVMEKLSLEMKSLISLHIQMHKKFLEINS